MKVGDLVRWYVIANDEQPLVDYEYGTIIRIGLVQDLHGMPAPVDMALVLFTDGTQDWISLNNLVVISEA